MVAHCNEDQINFTNYIFTMWCDRFCFRIARKGLTEINKEINIKKVLGTKKGKKFVGVPEKKIIRWLVLQNHAEPCWRDDAANVAISMAAGLDPSGFVL